MKVLHGPVNVGNQPWVLSRHERKLGVRSDLVVNYQTWHQYPADRQLGACGDKSLTSVSRRLWFGLTAALRYDVLHLYFGRSFLTWEDLGPPRVWDFWDQMFANRLGRKLFMTLQGCDVRFSDQSAQRDEYTPCQLGNCAVAADCRATLDTQRRHLIADVLPRFHRLFVLNPELAHFVPGSVFLPYANVDVESFPASYPKIDGPITLLHAPSDEGIKGTPLIIKAVENLKKRWDLELVLVRGVPHAEAMRLYQRADLIIDQALAGWYGGFAVEVMAMGKPVACYLRDGDLGFVPPRMRAELPLVRITPRTIEADLEGALRRRHEWPNWGAQARAFVRRWHNPALIAEAMVAAYRSPDSIFDLENVLARQRACAA